MALIINRRVPRVEKGMLLKGNREENNNLDEFTLS